MSSAQRRIGSEDASQQGFTLVEVLAAIAIGMVLALAVTGVITSTLNVVADAELAAASGGLAQRALTGFSTTAREATVVFSASPTTLGYSYQSGGKCQLHWYLLTHDPKNVGRLSLIHFFQSRQTATTTAGCGYALDDILASTSYSTLSANRTELTDLSPTSRFTFYTSSGQVALVPGDTGFTVSAATPLCLLGGVALNLDTRVVTRNKTTTSSEYAFAAFQNNVRGLGCGVL